MQWRGVRALHGNSRYGWPAGKCRWTNRPAGVTPTVPIRSFTAAIEHLERLGLIVERADGLRG
jgi:hypothetical protein